MTGETILALIGLGSIALAITAIVIALVTELAADVRDRRSVEAFVDDFIPDSVDVAAAEAALPDLAPESVDTRGAE